MFIAGIDLKFGGKVLETGMPIPFDHGMAPHIFQAHLSRRSILDVDEQRAKEYRERYLRGKVEDEKRALKDAAAKLEDGIYKARRDVEASAKAARLAEQHHAKAVEERRVEESKAKDRLASLTAELKRLQDGGALKPEPSPQASKILPNPSAGLPDDDAGDATDPGAYTEAALKRLSKAELLSIAEGLSIAAGEDSTKADIIEAILEAKPA